jgi:hypothetical protein
MKKVMLYLLDNLQFIMGQDEDDKIKDACRVFSISNGQAVAPLFMGASKEHLRGKDIKKPSNILSVAKPTNELLVAYDQFLNGVTEKTKKVIKPNLKPLVH